MEEFIRPVFFLIVIILLARLSTLLARRFDIPAAAIQLLIGILLGPSLLNLLGGPMILGTWGSPSPSPLHDLLKILAEIGLIELMFLAGLQVDWRGLKGMLKPIFSVGGWEFVLTVVGVTIIMRWFVGRWAEALAMGAIMAASGFGISVYNLSEMKFVGSRAAKAISATGALCGVLGILLMIMSLATNYATVYGGFKMIIAVSWFLGKLIMFFAISYFLTSRFLKLTANRFQKRPRQMLIGYLLLVAALYAWAAMHFGSFAAVVVASLGGALLGIANPGLKERIEGGLGSVLASLPVGIFFIVFGTEANFKGIEGHVIFLTMLFAMVIGTKLVGGWIATRKTPEDLSERLLVASGTLPQGEMGLLIAAYAFSRGLVDPVSFNVAMIVVVVLAMLAPVLMKVVSAEWRKREVAAVPPFSACLRLPVGRQGGDKRCRRQ
jgi:Kef-type K+ transport system membrane component KefB